MMGVNSKFKLNRVNKLLHLAHETINKNIIQNNHVLSQIRSLRTATNASKQQSFNILRYNPEKDFQPYMEEFVINTDGCGPMVLDALFKIKDDLDSSLSFRRSCREGICGSCAMNINGKNALACLTPILPEHDGAVGSSQEADVSPLPPIEVRPLPNMYVVRDLVPDMSNFYNQYKSIDPWMKRKDTKPEDAPEYYQSKEDRAKLDGLYECILCACCQTSCPSYWWNPETFLGPAVLLQAYRWVIDSRDDNTMERLSTVNDTMKLFRCHGIMNCTSCCPKGLDPAGAIRKVKALVEKHFDEGWDALKASEIRAKAKARLARERKESSSSPQASTSTPPPKQANEGIANSQ